MGDDIKLNERELAIAAKAAEMAVKQMQDEFYRTVGRNVISKFVIVVGGIVVAVSMGFDRWLGK